MSEFLGAWKLYIIAALLAGASFSGWKVRDWQASAEKLKEQDASFELRRFNEKLGASSGTQHEQFKANQIVKDRVIIQEVERVVQGSDFYGPDGLCLDTRGMQVLDHAWDDPADPSQSGSALPTTGKAQ